MNLNDEDDNDKKAFVKVSDLFSMKAADQQKMKRKLSVDLKLDDTDQLRMELSLSRFNEAFSKDENVLQFSIVDENLPKDSVDRKTEADVLEIFVRIISAPPRAVQSCGLERRPPFISRPHRIRLLAFVPSMP